MSGHIYILCEREFVVSGTPVYKLGRTTNIKRRLSEYSKGSELLLSVRVGQVNETETHLLGLFRADYIARTDIGQEYFEGDAGSMMLKIMSVATLNLSNFDAPPIRMEPALKAVCDPSIVVIEFVENHLEELSNQVLPSRDVYARLCEWVDAKKYKVKLSHCMLTKELMLSFKVRHGVHRFAKGLNRALYFPDLTPPPVASDCENPPPCRIIEYIEHLYKAMTITDGYSVTGSELFNNYLEWTKGGDVDTRGSSIVMEMIKEYGVKTGGIVKKKTKQSRLYVFYREGIMKLLEGKGLMSPYITAVEPIKPQTHPSNHKHAHQTA